MIRAVAMAFAAVTCALGARSAPAQVGTLIEIRVVGEGEGVNGFGRVEATFLIDTGKAIKDGVVKAADATAAFSMDQTPTPFDHTGGVYKQDEGALALLELDPARNGYALTVVGRPPDPYVSLRLEVVGARGFSPSLVTLPEDPSAYFVTPSGRVLLEYAEQSGSIASIGWGEPVGFFGGKFSVTVREAQPAPADLCDADLAAPFGVLNFSDVLAYLDAYAAGCP